MAIFSRGKKEGSTRVATYEMSIHFAIAMGPIDGLHRIFVGEKVAWSGFATTQQTYVIDQPQLFGGEEKEGGAVGSFHYMPGLATQLTPDAIAAKWDLTSATAPGFRGFASLFFGDNSFDKGFTWAANNPYLKSVWATVRRAPVGLDENQALIARLAPEAPPEVPDEIRFFDGFDTYETTVEASNGMWGKAIASGASSLVAGRYGGQALSIQGNSFIQGMNWSPAALKEDASDFTSGDHFTLGFNLKFASTLNFGPGESTYQIAGWFDGANSSSIMLYYSRETRTFTFKHTVTNVRTNAGGTVIVESDEVSFDVWNEWRFIEIETEFANSGGRLKLYVDGNIIIDFTGDTIYGSTGDRFCLVAGWAGFSNRVSHTFDDVYCKIGGPLGPTRIVPLLPTGDYLTEWTGGPPQWSRVDDIGSETITSANTSDRSAFTFEAMPSFGAVYAIAVHEIGRRSAGSGTITGVGFIVEEGTTDTFHEEQHLSILEGSYGGMQAYFQDNPITGQPWTISEVNGVIAGIRNGQPTATHQVTKVALQVLYGFSESSSEELDANPAHIIFECLTNTEWGMGAPDSIIDMDSFNAVATVLFEENFGLSMIWTRQSSIESFVGEILDHIQATLFLHPRTGLLTLKLIRGDYTAGALPILTQDHCIVENFSRRAWGDTTNEIVTTWTNPENEQEETVSLQDLANIAVQGAIVSDSRNYYGIRYSELAMRVTARDLAQAAAPLASMDIRADRTAGDFVPGGVFRLTYPEHGLSNLVVRILTADYGKPRDSKVRLKVVEDIFAATTMAYTDPSGSEWVDESEEPAAMEYIQPFTQPAYVVANTTGDLSTLEYPEVRNGMLAARDSTDTIGFSLMEEQVLPNGDLNNAVVANLNMATRSTLSEELAPEAESTVVFGNPMIGGDGPTTSGFIFIGEGDDTEMELALLVSEALGEWTIARGILDTTPKLWPVGTPVWFVGLSLDVFDPSTYSAMETAKYRLLTRTSLGTLAEGDATEVLWESSERPHLPLRPADVKVLGIGYATIDNPVDATGETSGLAEVTWANRNRLEETGVILSWDEAGVTPEDGQTTTITLMKLDRTVITTIDGLTGESYNLDLTDFGSNSMGIVRVTSKRDGLESLQGHEIIVIAQAGYGFGYGFNYGGTP